MKKGKKIIALIVGVLMIASLAIGLAACNSAGKTVGMFWYKQTDIYLGSVRTQVNDSVFNDTDFKVRHFYADNSDSKLKDLVEQNVADLDVLIVNPVDAQNTENLKAIVKIAKDAGKPIVFFNKEVGNDVIADYDKAYYIGTVSKESGEIQGELIADFLLKGTNADKYASSYEEDGLTVIYYAMVRGQEGHADSDARTYYSVMVANEALEEEGYILKPSPDNPNSSSWTFTGAKQTLGALPVELETEAQKEMFKKFVSGNNEWSGEDADANFDTGFSAFLGDPDLTDHLGIIISNNDGMALAIINGTLKSNGYNLKDSATTAGAKYIPIFGVDGDSANLDLIDAGRMTGTVGQSAKAYAQLFLYYSLYLIGDTDAANTLKSSTGFVTSGYVNELLAKKVFFHYEPLV